MAWFSSFSLLSIHLKKRNKTNETRRYIFMYLGKEIKFKNVGLIVLSYTIYNLTDRALQTSLSFYYSFA